MKKKFAKRTAIAILIATIGWVPAAFSGTWCEGYVNNININSNGKVTVSFSWWDIDANNYNAFLCQLDQTHMGTMPEVCKVWVTALQAAQYTDTSIKVFLPGGCYSGIVESEPVTAITTISK